MWTKGREIRSLFNNHTIRKGPAGLRSIYRFASRMVSSKPNEETGRIKQRVKRKQTAKVRTVDLLPGSISQWLNDRTTNQKDLQ